jgi:hypothetical protein
MMPGARRNLLLGGLTLAAVFALFNVAQSRDSWFARFEEESAARAAREAEIEERQKSHEEEIARFERRVAEMQSDLEIAREERASAERKAASALAPSEELASAKAELDRAYGRIRELETGADAPGIFSGQIRGKAVRFLASSKSPPLSGEKLTFLAEGDGGSAEPPTRVRDLPVEGKLVEMSATEVRIRAAIERIQAGDVILGRRIESANPGQPAPQRFEGGLNQGVDYVEPEPPAAEPPRAEGGLNQGVQYVDPETPKAAGVEQEVELEILYKR